MADQREPDLPPMAAHFAADIVADILSRLPVEPILRFRCVSKPWCALIDSPYFIKLHLKRSKKNHEYLVLRNPNSLFSVSMAALDPSSSSPFDVPVRHEHHPPPPLKKKDNSLYVISIWGSCDGLVLLRNQETLQVLIWNPTTKKYRELPNDEIHLSDKSYLYGIGYDSVHDDHKVLEIINCFNPSGSEVKIYSLRTNSWKTIISDFPYTITCSCGVLVSGALHWSVVSKKGNGFTRFIVAFDLATEEYRILHLPSSYNYTGCHRPEKLSALDGCLYLFSSKSSVDGFDIWVIKDYGVNEQSPWTKLLSVSQSIDNTSSTVVMAFSMDGGILLLLKDYYGGLKWYDVHGHLFKKVHRVDQQIFEAQICVQSLVPLCMQVASRN